VSQDKKIKSGGNPTRGNRVEERLVAALRSGVGRSGKRGQNPAEDERETENSFQRRLLNPGGKPVGGGEPPSG